MAEKKDNAPAPKGVRGDLDAGRVVIVTGFQGIDPDGNITTLGRGGSDTSAVAIAAALKADECQIYTDVDGVYTTDPRVVENARRLKTITFEEMLELASLGSKVLQIRSVEFAGKYKVPMRVLSSFTPWDIDLAEEARSGTLITFDEDEKMEFILYKNRTSFRARLENLLVWLTMGIILPNSEFLYSLSSIRVLSSSNKLS